MSLRRESVAFRMELVVDLEGDVCPRRQGIELLIYLMKILVVAVDLAWYMRIMTLLPMCLGHNIGEAEIGK